MSTTTAPAWHDLDTEITNRLTEDAVLLNARETVLSILGIDFETATELYGHGRAAWLANVHTVPHITEYMIDRPTAWYPGDWGAVGSVDLVHVTSQRSGSEVILDTINYHFEDGFDRDFKVFSDT